MPAPTSVTLPMSSSHVKPAGVRPRRRGARGSARRARDPLSGSVKEMSVWPGGGHVLDDHVDVDARVGERAEDAAGDARTVGDGEDRHLRLAGVARDSRDDRLLEHVLLLHDPGALRLANDERTWIGTPWLRAYSTDAQREHLRAGRGELEHLLVRDGGELARRRARSAGRRCRRPRRRCRSRRRPRRAPRRARPRSCRSRRGRASSRRSSSRRPGSRRRSRSSPRRAPRARRCARSSTIRALPWRRVGDDAGLRAGERDGLVAEVVDRHREERHRDPLAGGEQHVQLAGVRTLRDLAREVDQLVRRVAHRGDDDADAVAGLGGRDDPPRDALDPLGIGDRGAAVLLDHDRHGASIVVEPSTNGPKRGTFPFYGLGRRTRATRIRTTGSPSRT